MAIPFTTCERGVFMQDLRRCKAELLLEYQEAEENLAVLTEETNTTTSRLRDTIELLENTKPKAFGSGVPQVEQRKAQRSQALRALIATDERYRNALNPDLLSDLVERLEQAKAIRDQLRERKTALGLK